MPAIAVAMVVHVRACIHIYVYIYIYIYIFTFMYVRTYVLSASVCFQAVVTAPFLLSQVCIVCFAFLGVPFFCKGVANLFFQRCGYSAFLFRSPKSPTVPWSCGPFVLWALRPLGLWPLGASDREVVLIFPVYS